ncbi:MAG TPA: hypothetical protein DCF68_05200 [Cyanothece sp. UBA12306]|nr:hypothetical protein [Cyanothece sp. UBA12306]
MKINHQQIKELEIKLEQEKSRLKFHNEPLKVKLKQLLEALKFTCNSNEKLRIMNEMDKIEGQVELKIFSNYCISF